MKILIKCVLAAVFVLAFAMPVDAAEHEFGRQLRQTHTIEIEVECIEASMAVIRELNGYNLESSVEANWRAFVTRRVDGWAFRHTQEVLRGLGEVIFEAENAWHLGAQLSDLEIRLETISQEIERLSTMMAASDSLAVLIAIDSHLSSVMWERDRLIGTRNLLMSQAGSPVINIHLFEIPEDRPLPVPLTFGRRVGDSFVNSWENLISGAGNLLVFVVRVALPAVIWAVILSIVGIAVFRVIRGYRRKLLVAQGATPQQNEDVIKEVVEDEEV